MPRSLACTLVAAVLGFGPLTACGVASVTIPGSATANPNNGGTPGTGNDANTTTNVPTSTQPTQSAIDPSKWATGGTALFATGVQYADPFGSTNGTQCTASCTIDSAFCPLAFTQPPDRQDISEGEDGLPMRLMLQVLDTGCTPISDAAVEIWHASPEGAYSGVTNTVSYCNNGDSQARATEAFRGSQTTGGDGLVTFDSCFPGWFGGRTLLINLRITPPNGDAVLTQVFFDDALVNDIVRTRPLYKDRGSRDTTNATDGRLNPSAIGPATAKVAQMADGAMLAYKTLVIDLDASGQSCSLAAASSPPSTQNPNQP